MERMAEVVAEKEPGTKVLNKTLARELGLTPQYFAVIKKRGKIPYMALALFAHKEGINLNWLLLGAQPKHINVDRPTETQALI
jgi:hypothetical protein